VVRAFVRSVFSWQRRQAEAMRLSDVHVGSVTFAQRFGSFLQLTPHAHLDPGRGLCRLTPHAHLDPGRGLCRDGGRLAALRGLAHAHRGRARQAISSYRLLREMGFRRSSFKTADETDVAASSRPRLRPAAARCGGGLISQCLILLLLLRLNGHSTSGTAAG